MASHSLTSLSTALVQLRYNGRELFETVTMKKIISFMKRTALFWIAPSSECSESWAPPPLHMLAVLQIKSYLCPVQYCQIRVRKTLARSKQKHSRHDKVRDMSMSNKIVRHLNTNEIERIFKVQLACFLLYRQNDYVFKTNFWNNNNQNNMSNSLPLNIHQSNERYFSKLYKFLMFWL